MNIYKIVMNDDKPTRVIDYVLHKKFFSQGEFQDMCKEALSECSDRNTVYLKARLITKFGFQAVAPVGLFEFND
ncbi:MAG: hypothetical protein AB6733_11375 [Clostridiaceae bacterium]